MRVELLVDNGSITAREPVLAKTELINQTDERLRVPRGSTSQPLSFWEIEDASGRVIAATPRTTRRPQGLQGSGAIPAHETETLIWTVSAFHQFNEPGRYVLRFKRIQEAEGFPVFCEAEARLQVLPLDTARLEATCQELYRPTKGKGRFGDLDLGLRVGALYSIRHDVVLPYLDRMARAWDDSNACRAMRRIGTPRAKALLDELCARQDSVGEAARRSLKMPLEVRPDEYSPM